MKDFIIIIPTHSSYKGIVVNFLQLFKKNWSDCPYKIVISITGEDVKFDDYETLYNGKNVSLVNCVINASKKYKYKYYICFLGDAFINSKVNNDEFVSQMNVILKNKIDYCCLNYVKRYKKEKKFNNYFRYINSMDKYNHSFVAFVSSSKFINNDIAKYKSDLEFEKKYLDIKENYYYDNHIIVRKNYLSILPSITKGKWDRINYKILKKENPEIIFENRKIESISDTILNWFRKKFMNIIPGFFRYIIKKVIGFIFRKKYISKT